MSSRDLSLLRTETFITIANRLNKACAWLKELGIEYPITRIGRYQKIFNTLAAHQVDGSLDKAITEVPIHEYINAGFEVQRLLYIYDGLNQATTAGIVDKLRESFRGHDLYILDNDGRSGRDITFELTIAAMFGRISDHVDMTQNADIVATLDRFPIYVECKRPRSLEKIEARIKEGLGQLESRYDQTSNPWMARGLLALSIEKAVNPKFDLLDAKNPTEIREMMIGAIRHVVNVYSPVWRKRARIRTLGVLVVLEAPALDGASNNVFIASQATMDALRPESSLEFGWLEQLAKGAMSRA